MGKLLSSPLPRPSAWKLEPEPSTFAPSSAWSNKDMDPVPPNSMRTWTTFNYVAYWISDAANASMWAFASSMLAICLSWWQALLAIAFGNIIMGIVMVLNGTTGARPHIAFPILNRSSFGYWLSYFSMLRAIWPSITHLPNHLPPSANITTSGAMICYFLYWLIQFPLMFIPPQKIRWLFLAKAIIVPPTWLALLIWALVKVPPSAGLFAQKAGLSGPLGNYATLGVNIPDFTRYAKTKSAQYIQLTIIPISFTLASFVGIAVTTWHRDNRGAAAFFTSFAFTLDTLGTNISANPLSAGNDMTALWPRYINIRRGEGHLRIPWRKGAVPMENTRESHNSHFRLHSATGFLTFMGGYTVFLGPITGIMITDYWLVHRTHVDVPAMYQPHGRYRYTYGLIRSCKSLLSNNWRAAAAMIVSVPPTMPGLINSINLNTNIQVGVSTRLFDIAYLLGFTLALTVYFMLSMLFPAHETMLDHTILELETLPDDGNISGSDTKKVDDYRIDETDGA
ncbi:NCS1 nucleoside transporter family [Russula emetica]|nr:NCS1 nucleoside transporter family [Russula emetica]